MPACPTPGGHGLQTTWQGPADSLHHPPTTPRAHARARTPFAAPSSRDPGMRGAARPPLLGRALPAPPPSAPAISGRCLPPAPAHQFSLPFPPAETLLSAEPQPGRDGGRRQAGGDRDAGTQEAERTAGRIPQEPPSPHLGAGQAPRGAMSTRQEAGREGADPRRGGPEAGLRGDRAPLSQQRRLKQATQFLHKDSADLLPLDSLKRLGTSKDLVRRPSPRTPDTGGGVRTPARSLQTPLPRCPRAQLSEGLSRSGASAAGWGCRLPGTRGAWGCPLRLGRPGGLAGVGPRSPSPPRPESPSEGRPLPGLFPSGGGTQGPCPCHAAGVPVAPGPLPASLQAPVLPAPVSSLASGGNGAGE